MILSGFKYFQAGLRGFNHVLSGLQLFGKIYNRDMSLQCEKVVSPTIFLIFSIGFYILKYKKIERSRMKQLWYKTILNILKVPISDVYTQKK